MGQRLLAPLLVIALLACAREPVLETQPPATATPPPRPPAATATDTPRSPSPTATSALPERTSYRFEVLLVPDARRLNVGMRLQYVHRAPEPVDALILIVEPNRFEGAFQLQEIRWADGSPVEGVLLERARMEVPLPQPLEPEDELDLTMRFDLLVPERAAAFGATERQINLTDWHPMVPPYHPETGWEVHEPVAWAEHLTYDLADFDMDLELRSDEPGWVVAASGTTRDGRRYELNRGRAFAFTASREYVLLSGSIGGVEVSGYVFPEHLGAGEAALQIALETVELFDGLIAPYPYDSLVFVEATFPDGRECSGLYYLDQVFFNSYDGSVHNFLTTLTVHEIAHQWWFSLVGNDQAFEPWLDEALSTYAEFLFYERYGVRSSRWWWNFRVDRFAPKGNVNSTIYQHGGFRPYVDAVYLRGALFLEELRTEIGDEAFFAFLQDYTASGSGRVMTEADFFGILADHTKANVQGLREEYFGGAP